MNNGKVALITGSSSGIGAQIAVQFATLGYRLSITGRNEAGLKDVLEKCLQEGLTSKDAIVTVADITSLDQAQMLMRRTIDEFGRLDVLVNNAGGSNGIKKWDEFTDDEFSYMLDLNVRAPLRLAKLAKPYLLQTKGNIVNISSVAGQRVFSHIELYGACKAALNYLTRAMALDLASQGVRVNAVSPGPTDTPVFGKLGLPVDEARDLFTSLCPSGRMASTSEISRAVVFLADDQSSYITGVNLAVDGGTTLGH